MDVNLAALTDREREIFEAGYLMGHADRQPEVDQANADADRYYAAAFNPPARIPDGPSYAEREQRRREDAERNAVTTITPWEDVTTRVPPGTTPTRPTRSTEHAR